MDNSESQYAKIIFVEKPEPCQYAKIIFVENTENIDAVRELQERNLMLENDRNVLDNVPETCSDCRCTECECVIITCKRCKEEIPDEYFNYLGKTRLYCRECGEIHCEECMVLYRCKNCLHEHYICNDCMEDMDEYCDE